MATKKALLGAQGLDANGQPIVNASNITASNTITAQTFSGSGASLTNIPNSALNNSSITINSTPVSLGGSITVSATDSSKLPLAGGTLTGSLSGTSASFSSSVTASSLIKSGGISSQFLKADGSVDANTYYLASNPSGYITSTATITGDARNITQYAINQNLSTTSSPTFSGLTVDTNTLFVDATNDRVGIGTVSPTGLLQLSTPNWRKGVLDTTGVTAKAYQGSDANGLNFTTNIYWSGSAWTQDDSTKSCFAYIQHLGNNRMEFRVSPAGAFSSWTTAMVIDTSGNVGIANVSPAYKLDVNGTLNATGSITQNGSQVLTASNLLNYAQSTTEWYHSNRDFVNGTLITTSIDYSVTSGDPFILEIRGNSYGNLIPFSIQIQGYIYNNTIINYGGYSIGGAFNIIAMNVGGNLCFWFSRQAYWQGFNVKCYTAYPTRALNKVTSITDVVEPTAGTKKVTITPTQVLRSDNYSSYALPLSGGTISGNLSVTGTLNASSTLSQGGNQVLHAGNYSSYAIPVSGGINMSGGYGLNDQRLFLRTNGDTNHYLWNANDDWEELVAYAGTGFRIASSNGASLMTFTTSAVNSGVALQQGGNQVLHAGNVNTYSTTRFTTTIDASALNQSTFYPVIMFPNNGRQLKVRVKNVLNSNVPSWSTHPSGFTFVLDYEVNGHGWGTVVINRKIFNYSEGFTSARICGGIGQLGNGSAEYVMVRGGGIYYFEVDDSNCSPALYSSGYSYAGQSINPTTSTINDIWNSSAGTYLGVQAIYLPSYDGIYTQNNNGASFRPNDGTYGSWKIGGSRNGWNGIEFETTSNGTVSLMVQPNANTTGFYNNSAGWQFRWNVGTLYCHKGTYGGGTEATVLDSSNYSSYAIPNSGSWLGDLGSYGFTRYAGMSMSGGSEVVFLYKGGQGYTLIDGNYMAFEGGGFYSSYNSSGGTLIGMKAIATNTLELNARTSIRRSVYSVGANDFFMELTAPDDGSGSGEIGLRFHLENRYWRQIRANSGGFVFTQGGDNNTVPITASNVIAQNEVSATNGMTHYGGNRIPRTIVSTSTPGGTINDGDVWLQY